MKKKTFIVQILDSKNPSRKSFTQVEDANFYSNDTDASLVFIPHEDTFDFQTAKVVMYNRGDESLVERDAVVTTENGRKVASYELPAEIISHWGDWTAQPVFISNSEIYSGSIVPFSVIRYLMHERPPRLNEVVTITNFIQQSQALVDAMAQEEAQRVTQEQDRQSAETNRVQAENERSDKYGSYAQQFNDVITDLSEEKDYHSLPEISAARGGHDTLGQRLDETTTQLAHNTYFGIENQTDFVDVVRETNAIASNIFTRIRGDRSFEVCIPFKGTKSQQWYMAKDEFDDFMKLSGGFVSDYTKSVQITGNKNYDSVGGTWVTSSPPNHYTTVVGSTFTFTFDGVGFSFRHREDNRGGIWKFVVDGKEEWTYSYSTFGTSNNTKKSDIVKNLPKGSHTVVATFMGDDPENIPTGGADTSRGWVYFGSGATTTIDILDETLAFEKEIEVFKMTSNKEFALSVRPSGDSGNSQWIPEHNSIGTAFAIEQKVYFDNVLQENWSLQTNYQECNSVQVVQKMYGKHPDNVDNLIEFITMHTFNADGVFTKTKVKVLKDITITGYAMMAPVNYGFTDKLVTSLDNKYDILKTDSSLVDLVENDKALSYLFIGNSSYPDYVGAMTINQPKKTFRVGEASRRNPLIWLQFRSSALSKLYPQIFDSYLATAGEVFEFSGSYTIGEIPMADALYG